MRCRVACATSIVVVSLASLAGAQEPVDHEIVNLIRYEGFHNSQVLEIAAKADAQGEEGAFSTATR